jgi:hypothetical protein
MIRAGIPTTVQLGGTFLKTTAFAPTIELSPIWMSPYTFAPMAM